MPETTHSKPAGEKPKANGHDVSNINEHTDKIIGHVNVTVQAFLGEAVMTVAELQALSVESVVTLDSVLNQAVDLKLNGVRFAKGELVSVGDHFGIKITSISA